jgi:hypothetical protein
MSAALFTVVEESPDRLVLENRGTRIVAAVSVLGVGGVLAFGPVGLHAPLNLGGADVRVPALMGLGLLGLWAVVGALDRQRIVFDAGSGTVELTSLLPWKRWRRPLAEIEEVEASETEETYYSSSPGGVTTHTYHLIVRFRDGRRREVNRGGDRAAIDRLKARIDALRA